MHKKSNINILFARLMIEELVRLGVEHFVLSPGSRCTPLTIAVAEHKSATSSMHFDERGAAYYALGHARGSGKPAALVCTSGTAAVNYFPAVVEASMDRVPLILLTADRPPELQDCGANQTIDQVNLYGKYVRYFVDMPCPNKAVPPEFVLKTMDQAYHTSMSAPAGPVHLNCKFREPLAPHEAVESVATYLSPLDNWMSSSKPIASDNTAPCSMTGDTIERIASLLNGTREGMVVLGPTADRSGSEPVAALIEKLKWPVYADIRSGFRLGPKHQSVIAYFDQLLLSEKYAKLEPSAVLHLGGVVTSKRFNQFISGKQPDHYIQVAGHAENIDPNGKVTDRIEAEIGSFCREVLSAISDKKETSLLKRCHAADAAAHAAIDRFLDSSPTLSEPAVARLISGNIDAGNGLFLGSSMPIRDMDMYGVCDGPTVAVAANRGASGIDGTLASAAGFASGRKSATTLLIGDLAFLHDLNSLSLAARSVYPLVIVVINNNGGGIFSFLPIANAGEIFEPFFGTPHGVTFEKAASMFGLRHYRPSTIQEFVSDYETARNDTKSSIIEVITDRTDNLKFHQALQQKVKAAVSRS